MNRNNFLPHVALALVLILVAAFAGQVRKWRNSWHHHRRIISTRLDSRPYPGTVNDRQNNPNKGTELFVRFRPEVTREKIAAITGRLHDRVEDQIESVSGLDLIEGAQGQDAASLLDEYRRLPEVEYVDEIYSIQAEGLNPVRPNDPRFEEQWALANDGQQGGKSGADI